MNFLLAGVRVILILVIIANFGVPPFVSRVRELFIVRLTFKEVKRLILIIVLYVLVIGYARIFFLVSLIHRIKTFNKSINKELLNIALIARFTVNLFFL